MKESRYVQITMNESGYRIDTTAGALAELEVFLDASDPRNGESIRFEVIEMTDAEYDALPEFKGW